MTASRRTILKGAVGLGAAGLSGAASLVSPALAKGEKGLAITDSRLAEGKAFAVTARAKGLVVHDVAAFDGELWPMVQALPETRGRVTGLTGWADFVILRGLLEERGLRLVEERKLAHRGARPATPFAWEMG
jgi:hypothetical protein